MESVFLDNSCLSDDVNHIMIDFPLKDQFYYLKKLHSCSMIYRGIPTTRAQMMCLPTPLTGDHCSFLLGRKTGGSDSIGENPSNVGAVECSSNTVDPHTDNINSEGVPTDNINSANVPTTNINSANVPTTNINSVDVATTTSPANEAKTDREKLMSDILFLCFYKNGCKYVINKMKENEETEEKKIIQKSLLLDAVSLCPDVYGSYVAQSVFDLSDETYKERFADQFLEQTRYLSLHTYGCRLIQKSLESLCNEYRSKIFKQLQNDLITYICHQNGNHVIQKCIEVLPSGHIDTIISNIEEYLPFLSSHAYGCRIVQRIYEVGNTNQINRLNDKIVKKIYLIKNRYGNYVIQKCFEHSDDTVRFIITDEIVSDIYKLSSHKYACNIIEKILLKKEYKYKKKIIKKIVDDILEGNDNIITICKDCYGNFMMQKLLTTCRRKERSLIIKTIIENIDKLKDETYGKYILRAISNLET
ncbi:mRNA-binding protein PUF2, putative [Plasmodium knowlesi strain H]|uniref:mRNA-binding protein PUF2, putative n=3 Tax=Plasmodium knowlesi TaxID=5850 RepID=A0A5K1VLA4_PLAKH|nr:mRNA-binding protein PUF2, putative [Plasmodium knowlesi strain H]OTN68151.1 putative RNA-binding protein of pumilio/mpt5 family [Plasmodium knowlesi]CAA9986982.1 mRNA-binding protein PUF2, putative [Plasmodium knowlesi strain H]SBO26617.1 mRNA-binding protein PUF2, putative [Plasmodium knowlesi strain H]VVS76456.1 mRNA-binding protein PUF2, putative [Plasmodium knowlesi strain H]|eukprot:XP_002258227.1 RNA-binding protein of pumilio/mpt5 family,putative [Plasmodium knowlesi strain H]